MWECAGMCRCQLPSLVVISTAMTSKDVFICNLYLQNCDYRGMCVLLMYLSSTQGSEKYNKFILSIKNNAFDY